MEGERLTTLILIKESQSSGFNVKHTGLRAKGVSRYKEEHSIMTVGSILQEDLIIFSVYLPKSRV